MKKFYLPVELTCKYPHLFRGLRSLGLAALLSLGTQLPLHARAQANPEIAAPVTLQLKSVPLKEALAQIEKKTSYKFVYNDQQLDKLGNVSYTGSNAKLSDVLNTILRNTNLEYSLVGNSIVLSQKSQKQDNRTLKGKVTDDQGQPLPGASVAIKGTTTGTITDMNGNYSLRVRSAEDVLVISFIGFERQEVRVGNQEFLNITLGQDSNKLNEVVVTALGIEREEKALGYAVTKVSGEELMEARPNNFASALSGKVAGLNLVSTGSGPVNTTTIKLRGDNSLNPSKNQALIVLDGVPMNSGLTESGVGNAYGAGSGNDVPVDFGNGISNINPDDIESITVLKGASAAALYGHRAANGALIITTKSGSRNKKGLGVTVNTNISFDDVLKWPDYQYEYGQGTGRAFNKDGELYYSYGASEDGSNTGGTSSAYGPKFDGQLYYQYDPETEGQSPERRPWRPYKDNIKGFWRTGQTISNNVAIEGGNEKGSARASITHTKNDWIMPNTGFERLNTSLSLNYKVADKLRLNSKVNFAHKKSDNLPATGYNNQSIAYFMIFQNPSIDLAWYEPRWKQGKYQVDQIHPFSSFIDNPYVIAYEMTNGVDNYSTVGNLSATYEISPKFEVMVRSGVDLSNEDRTMQRPYSTANFQKGYYKEQTIFDLQQNTDAMLTYKDKITSRIDVRAMLGGNIMSQHYKRTEGYVDGLVIPGVYKLSNGINNPMMRTIERNGEVHSVFGLMTVSYDDKIFVDVTARNDWSSMLPVKNSSFFYPSVNTSFILTDLFRLPTAVSYAKLRLSVAEVGNGGDPYQTNRYYIPSEFAGSATADYTLFNANLKPEMATNYEAGLEYRLFGGRLGMDINLYRNITRNQIVAVPLDPTTGYREAFLNAGKVQNQGIELAVTGKLLDHSNLKWNATLTWSKNQNEVLELAEGMDGSQIIGYGGNATIIAKVGGSTGDIYGYGFVRNPEGKIVYNKDGLPERPDEIQYIGNAYADWKGGLRNEVSYKNLRFSMLLDGQYGGIVYSQTHHKMSEMGKLKHTLMGREEGFIIGNGVVDNGDGTYSPNTTKVLPVDYYRDYYRRANVESNSFDASYLKLREMRVEYSLPQQLLSRTKFIQGASVAVYGRNLAMITDFPIFDPETAALNGSQALPGVEMGQLPTPRTYGMNVTLKF
ncbi:MAG: SusC/RagA family TonB-linked outer membrane protein [Hymenobacteraceae bacterium]|nr:SusC/RagA family TonB-linked outer membrane protein [Hymenobacteraceae bacterium]